MNIGTTTFGTPFIIPPETRAQHFYIIGSTGTGKSGLLENMILSDASRNDGLALIDPHGGLAEAILGNCRKELIYINPADMEQPVGINFLAGIPDDHKSYMAEAIVSAFHTVWPDAWGPRMEYICQFASKRDPGFASNRDPL